MAVSPEPRYSGTIQVEIGDHARDAQVQRLLAEIDRDADGRISLVELISAAEREANAKAEARRARWALGVGAVLYALTVGVFFVVALGANSLTKDSYATGALLTDADGGVLSTATALNGNDFVLSDVLTYSRGWLNGLTQLEFPAGDLNFVTFRVGMVLAWGEGAGDAEWTDVEFRAVTGEKVTVNATHAYMYAMDGSLMASVNFTISEEEDASGRRLQFGGRRPPVPRQLVQSAAQFDPSSIELTRTGSFSLGNNDRDTSRRQQGGASGGGGSLLLPPINGGSAPFDLSQLNLGNQGGLNLGQNNGNQRPRPVMGGAA